MHEYSVKHQCDEGRNEELNDFIYFMSGIVASWILALHARILKSGMRRRRMERQKVDWHVTVYRTNIKLSSWKTPNRFFSVSLARAHVHVSDGSCEGPAGEYMLIYADREVRDILCREERCIKRESGPGVPSLPSLEFLKNECFFIFMRLPLAKSEAPSNPVA